MKKIGILSWQIGENSFGVTIPYLMWIEMFGQVRILDYKEPIDMSLDALVLPGGPDIDPRRYHDIPGRFTGKACLYREYFDRHVLPIYIENNMPIFGICRGIQTLNVHFGGTLTQHMYHETSVKSRDELVHSIQYNENGTRFTEEVNSLHHQTVKTLGKGIRPIARYYSKKRKYLGAVEAIIHEQFPIAAVQYHPEELLNNNFANILFENLLDGISNNTYLPV